MKLIWITPESPFPANTGGRIGIWKRLLYLSKRNDIYLYSIIDKPDEMQYKNDILKVCKEVRMYPRYTFFKIKTACFFYPYPAISRWNRDMQRDIHLKCEKLKPDFVVVDFPQMYGVLDEEVRNKYKIVLNQHNIESETLLEIGKTTQNIFKRLIYQFVGKQMEKYEHNIYLNRDVCLYTFVSIHDKEKFEKKYNIHNTYLIPVGTEIEKYPLLVNSSSAMFVGKMSYLPNELGAKWLLNSIWDAVSKECKNAKLYLVGKDSDTVLIKEAAAFDNVIVTGEVDSIDEYYKKCNVVLIPIFSGGGVKVKLLEAMGHGKLVVSTTKGLEGTDFKPMIHILTADNEEQFIKLCIAALNSPENFERIRKNSYEKVIREYSWEIIINDFEKKLFELK